MNTFWSVHYRVRSYIRSSLWIIPIVAVLLQQIFGRLLQVLDTRLGLSFLGFGIEGAKALFNAVITFSLSFIVFTFGSLLIAIQVSSGQYTPRIIATTLLRNNVIRYTVGLFVFTFLFAIRGLNQTETTVHQLVVLVTGLLGLICLAAFLYLIDYCARFLRPVSLMANVAEQGLAVIDSVYPEPFHGGAKPDTILEIDAGPIEQTIFRHGNSAIVTAINTKRLIAEADKANGVIEFAPHVGDFVGNDEPLFFLRGGAARVDERILRGSVIFGGERTLEQDPLFAFRILIDIAIKALSPAINDPTTGVLAIDQLQRLLRRAGRRELRTDYVPGPDGNVRLILRTPNWEDFVHLTFTEIRFYGASNIQIARRLRASIINLTSTLPAERHTALQQELNLLDQMLERSYHCPEDLEQARIADSQGLGAAVPRKSAFVLPEII
ncbi:MAG TPA: DUF2254 domain-containing protein [Candidatus Udaeobacter sp.]|nr:DUF2254 domain-containing protein [Candidatus Udaeobacter sp.]